MPAAEQETAVLNRSNAFRIVPPSSSNGLASLAGDVTYRSTASCQLCRNLRDKSAAVRLLPTVTEQTVWMPTGPADAQQHGPVVLAADDRLVDNSVMQLSNLTVDGGVDSQTNNLSPSERSSSTSSEM